MGYQIDSDTNPPILAAQMSAGAGQKMTVSVTIPAGYYDARAPIGYIYADGYGGQVSAVSRSANTATITAHSTAGDSVLDYARVNPHIQQADTLQSWLTGLCALGRVSAQYTADAAILASVPYTRQQAVDSLMGVLQTIANCYGMDVYHKSNADGDKLLFAHPSATPMYALDDVVTSLTYTDQDREYDQCVICRTAPIQQRVQTPLNNERLNILQKTSQNHPYLEAEIEYNEIDRYWDGKTTTYSYEELKNLDAETIIQDWDTIDSQDEWYKSKFAYAPYFGNHLVKRTHWKKHTLYYIIITGSPYGWDTTEQRIGYAEDPEWDPYEIADGESTSEENQYYGVWSTNRPWAYYDWSTTSSVWYLNPSPVGPNPDIEHGGDSGISDYGDVYPNPPNYFLQAYKVSDSWQQSDYRHKASSQEGYQTYKTVRGESDYTDTITQYQPTVYQYPWLPIAREQVSRVLHSQSVDTHVQGETETEYTETLTVSKALFDAGFDDFVKPPTIDENYLETGSLDNIRLEKSTHTWFDAEANPDPDRQYMSLGAVQNWKYKLATSQEKIYIQAGNEPGRLTAAWVDGTQPPQYYNLRAGMSLNRIYTGDQTLQLTFVSSAGKSFTTAAANSKGKSYAITGSVWPTKEIALLCIPYISRSHNRGRSVSIGVPSVKLSIAAAVGLLGKTVSLRGEAIYIYGMSADWQTERVSLSGYVVTE